ncbi:acyltransferase family protein [Ralstonia sp. 25mfcol4.1]|uniref:acyltransferase family protein n=1 Tax=Ralstonia sp. 25mfcol4.1 TaxID=1761899 RepID=UPI0015876F8C|nr:acyltransferase family protein [Ralstonia sp. 25mfcol4.1]
MLNSSTRPAHSTGFRSDINGLRAVAVLAVVLYHFQIQGFRGGFVGVDIFFVISGFLMTQIIWKGLWSDTFRFRAFYASRARRIVPPLVTVALATMLFCGAFLMPGEFKKLSAQVLSSLSFVSNLLFASEAGYFDSGASTKWMLHTWSLSVEWQFYILYPVALFALYRSPWRQHASKILAAAALASIALCIWMTRTTPSNAFYLPYTRCWEFLAGAMVYFHATKLRGIPLKTEIGILLIIGCVVGFDHNLAFPGYWAILPVAASTLIIADARVSGMLRNWPAQVIGSISYSLYLWHWPVVVALAYFSASTGYRYIGLAGSFIAAWLSYRFIESRFQRKVSADRTAVRHPLALPAYLLVTIGVTAVYLTQGMPMRASNGNGAMVVRNEALSQEWKYPKGCGSVATVTGTATVKYCSLGPVGANKVLVWGDSHAEHLYPTFEDIVAQGNNAGRQIVFGTYGGCMPVRGLDRPKSQGGLQCANFNEQVFEYASRLDIDAVVISSVWTAFFPPTVYDGRDNALPPICTAGKCDRFPTLAASYDFVRHHLTSDVGSLVRAGKQVTIMLPVPVYPAAVADTLAKAQWTNHAVDLHQTLDQHKAYTADVREMLQIVARDTGAQLLDPSATLCPNTMCQYEKGGISLYKDRNHLAPDAARALVPLIATSFQRLTGSPTSSASTQ